MCRTRRRCILFFVAQFDAKQRKMLRVLVPFPPKTPSVHSIKPAVSQPLKQLATSSQVSKKRSCSLEPSLLATSAKRRAATPVASAPRKSGLNDQSEPYIQLPEQIFVWWTCSCGFQVLQHKDLTCHGPRRKKHLNQVHGIQYSDMPPDPLGAPDAEGTQTRREERVKRCQRWLNIAKNHGWAGMHELTPVNLG